MEDHRCLLPGPGQAVVLLALVTAVQVSPAGAADTPANPLAPADASDEALYRKTIREGVAEYEAGHFEEARSLFRRAHETNPSARTYRGIGMAAFELRDYVAAVRNLSAAIQDKRKPLSSEQHKETTDLLDRTRMFVDVCVVKAVPSTARILVDRHPAEFESDGTLLLGFGMHTIEASAPGMVARSESINVRGGARREVLLALEAVPLARTRSAPGAPIGLATQAPPAPKPSHRASAAWLWSGAGVALLAAGAGYYWYRQNSELRSCRAPASGLRCTDEGTLSMQRNLGMTATLGTGAAALTMALVGLLTWNSGPPSAPPRAALACSASPFGITCGKPL